MNRNRCANNQKVWRICHSLYTEGVDRVMHTVVSIARISLCRSIVVIFTLKLFFDEMSIKKSQMKIFE